MGIVASVTTVALHNDSDDLYIITMGLTIRDHSERIYITNLQAPQPEVPEDPENPPPPPDPPLPTTFVVGETITGDVGGATAEVDRRGAGYIVISNQSDSLFVPGELVVGADSEVEADVVKIGDAVVLQQNFTQNHNTNNNVSVAVLALKAKMESAIHDYNRTLALTKSSVVSTAANWLTINLDMDA